MQKQNLGNYPYYVQRYLDMVPESDLNEAFSNQMASIKHIVERIDETKANYSYAEGKWTLKELLQHCIDTERIFSFRALAFARKEPASLPGFEEDDYAKNSFANERSWKSLVEELLAVRNATEKLFNSFNNVALHYSGLANNNESSVISIGFLTVGHLAHHLKIIEERYL